MAKTRCCSVCHQPGHRADRCPQAGGPAAPKAPRSAREPRDMVEQLVREAEALGEAKALAAVEEATGEVLRRSQELRLALIKSRAANAKLRARLADQVEAKALAKLDREEQAGE